MAMQPVARRLDRLRRFPNENRVFVARISRRSPALEDLIDTFPALIFALATGYGTYTDRSAAIQCVERGERLKFAADALGLPMWLRRIPADALDQSLPVFPCGAKLDRQIAANVPDTPKSARKWFQRVSLAARIGDPEFFLWMAKHANRLGRDVDGDVATFICGWAWFSLNPDLPASALLKRPWRPSTGARSAATLAYVWRRRLVMAACLSRQPDLRWPQRGSDTAYRFVSLRSPDDMIAEAAAMTNCLDTYASPLRNGRTALFSVRRDGKPVADLEIALPRDPSDTASIVQLKGPKNRKAGPQVWRAARTWLAQQNGRLKRPPAAPREALIGQTLSGYLEPYIQHVGAEHAIGYADWSRFASKGIRRKRPDAPRV